MGRDHQKTEIFTLQSITIAILQLWSSNENNPTVGGGGSGSLRKDG